VAEDPTLTDPDKYKVVFENDRVRVLEYRDEPGQSTSPHRHPDSVMYTLSSFDRRLVAEDGGSRDVTLEAGEVRWLDAQIHSGENVGATLTHVLFVELKEPGPSSGGAGLGPS
jgi:quercetin dioxygenase-like cupin family protein